MGFRIVCIPICFVLGALTLAGSTAGSAQTSGTHELVMHALIQQFTANRASLQRIYPLDISAVRIERFNRFYTDELQALEEIDFDHLAHSDQVDYLLLQNLLVSEMHQQSIRQKQIAEMTPLLPFEKNVESPLEAKRLMQRPDGEKTAALLTEITQQIDAVRQKLGPTSQSGEMTSSSKPQIDRVVANRANNTVHAISTASTTGLISTTATIRPLPGGSTNRTTTPFFTRMPCLLNCFAPIWRTAN